MDFRSVRRAGLATVFATVMAACGGSPTGPSGGGGNGGGAVTVTGLTIGGDLTITAGETSQLTATATKSDGSTEVVTGQATWVSSDVTVATVSATGLLTALKTGTADISAAFSSQTGRGTLQVASAQFRIALALQSITALSTCDDFTQGLTVGEFATRIQTTRSGGNVDILDETDSSYPGNPNNLLIYELREDQTLTFSVTRNYTLTGEAGQFVRVQFNATEWDSQIVIIPPSTRWIHDSRMDNDSISRTHSYTNGTFSGLGSNTLTVGNSSCGIRVGYTIGATRQ